MAVPVSFSINVQGLELMDELLAVKQLQYGDKIKMSDIFHEGLQRCAHAKKLEIEEHIRKLRDNGASQEEWEKEEIANEKLHKALAAFYQTRGNLA